VDPLRLTPAQLTMLEAVNKVDQVAGINATALGKYLGHDDRFIRNYLRPRMDALLKRGFLSRTGKGIKARWRLGPMADALKEEGTLK
jgi:hypothetical protein